MQVPTTTAAIQQNTSPLPQLPMTSAPSIPALVTHALPVPDEFARPDALFTPASSPGSLEVHEVSSMGIRDQEVRAASQLATNPKTAETVAAPPPTVPATTPSLSRTGSAQPPNSPVVLPTAAGMDD